MADDYTANYEADYGENSPLVEPTGGIVTATMTAVGGNGVTVRREGKTDYDPATSSFYIFADAPEVEFAAGVVDVGGRAGTTVTLQGLKPEVLGQANLSGATTGATVIVSASQPTVNPPPSYNPTTYFLTRALLELIRKRWPWIRAYLPPEE